MNFVSDMIKLVAAFWFGTDLWWFHLYFNDGSVFFLATMSCIIN